MAIYYVAPDGNDANDGTTWAKRKKTLNGAEDIPVQAGDTVYVAPGTYRETLTVDVSGSAGNPITYIGDYTGAHTDGVGGVVRITGSNDNKTATRGNAISANSKDYRTYESIAFDMTINQNVDAYNVQHWRFADCYFGDANKGAIQFTGDRQKNIEITNCFFYGVIRSILFYHSADVNDVGHVVSNCIGIGYAHSDGTLVQVENIGGVIVKDCYLRGYYRGVSVVDPPGAGQTVVVNNCIFNGCAFALYSQSAGFITENYNTFYRNGTNRTNVTAGGDSKDYPALLDTRWFFELVNGGRVVSPFDLASYSPLVGLAGTSPTATDMRGTGAIGGVREWGPLEYDPDLIVKGGGGGSGGVSRARIIGGV